MNNKFLKILFLITTFFCNINTIVFIKKFLTNYHLSLIDKILINPKTSFIERNKIHNILYVYYDQWAFTKAYQFKQLHKYKCQHISVVELYSYASIGLYNSIKKYNPKYKYNFINYANYYVEGELLKGMTNLHPITSISKSNRRKSYTDFNNSTVLSLKKSKVQLVGENDWIWDKIIKNKKEENQPYDKLIDYFYYTNLWEKINNLSLFQRRIIYYKYNFFFEKIRCNKEISDLMSCSEEWVRINIKKSLIQLDIVKNII